MKRKICLVCSALVLAALALIFILSSIGSPGYLELLEVKDGKAGTFDRISCKIFYLEWHGKTTELEFTLYRRSRVAGYAVPGVVGVQWNKTNGDVIGVKDGNVCKVKNGDKFKLTISKAYAYVRISYDNKTMHFSGTTGEMTEFSRS